jgi:hypothetical protein
MKKLPLLFATAALGAGLLATPAAAQVYFGADPGGAGVQVGRSGSASAPTTGAIVTGLMVTRATAASCVSGSGPQAAG